MTIHNYDTDSQVQNLNLTIKQVEELADETGFAPDNDLYLAVLVMLAGCVVGTNANKCFEFLSKGKTKVPRSLVRYVTQYLNRQGIWLNGGVNATAWLHPETGMVAFMFDAIRSLQVR